MLRRELWNQIKTLLPKMTRLALLSPPGSEWEPRAGEQCATWHHNRAAPGRAQSPKPGVHAEQRKACGPWRAGLGGLAPASKWDRRLYLSYGGKGTLLHSRWEYKLAQPLWTTVWRCLKKPKIELPYEPAIPSWVYIYISLLGIYSDKTIIRKDTCTPVFVTALFTAVKREKPKCPSADGWRKKVLYR